MENLMEMQNAETRPSRDIAIITTEIKELTAMAQRSALVYAVEIGRRLVEAKESLKHGEWGDWLKNEVNFSQSTANNFMKLYEGYGSKQFSLFGAELNSEAFASLSYTKALQLLALPEDEREKFAKEEHPEDMSVREIQAAIKAKEEAKGELAAVQKELDDSRAEIEELNRALEEKTDNEEIEDLKSQIEEVTAARESFRMEQERLKAEKESLELKLKNKKKELKDAKHGVEEKVHKAEKEAAERAEAAMKEDMAKLEERLEKAEKERHAANNEAAALEKKLKEAQNKLKSANAGVAEFKALFTNFQELAAKLKRRVEAIRATDPETAKKLQAAMNAVAEQLKEA